MKTADSTSLISAWLDGRITAQESEQLQQLLRDSAQVRQQFLSWCAMDAELRQHGLSYIEASTATNPTAAAPAASSFHWLALAAALALFAIGQWWYSRPATAPVSLAEQTQTGCAVLTQASAAKFAQHTGIKVGSTLQTGTLQLVEGVAQIEFFSGASMLLEAGTVIELLSPWEAICKQGRATVRVPPPAQGFKLRTAGMQLVDLGTEFGVKVDSKGNSEVHVFEGKVEAHPDNQSMRLLECGQSLRRDEALNLTAGQAKAEDFPSVEKLNALGTQHAEARHAAWSAHMEKARRDPRLLACYLFKHWPEDKWDRVINNFTEPRHPTRAGGAVGARWAEGRWPMKDALEFKSPGDRVRINLGTATYSALTFACWVRVDSVDRKYNSLLLTDGYDEGEPHWQIYENGSLMFSIAYHSSSNKKLNQIYYSPAIFDLSNQRNWHHLAVTYDNQSGMVTQYFDGAEISHEVHPQHIAGRPISYGFCEIGNWGIPTTPNNFPIRNLNGRMDEFLIFQSALSATEVKELYTAGRPD
jgi:ferric-dicitrate binding protein FerR (iron transport regulator)